MTIESRPARAAVSQMNSARTASASNPCGLWPGTSPGRWGLKSVTPWVPGHEPVAIVAQFVVVSVGSAGRQRRAMRPSDSSRLPTGSSP